LEKEVLMLKNLVNTEEDSCTTNACQDLKKNLNEACFSQYNHKNDYKNDYTGSNRYMSHSSAKKLSNIVFNENQFDIMGGMGGIGGIGGSGRKPYLRTNSYDHEQTLYNRHCMTDVKNNNMMHNNIYTNHFGMDLELDNMYNNNYNDGEADIIKENDELKKNLVEIKRNFIESVQNKDQQIKCLNFDLNVTIENCEKLIVEAEENYKKFKKQIEIEKINTNETEIELKNTNLKLKNYESTLISLKEENYKASVELSILQKEKQSNYHIKEYEDKNNAIQKELKLLKDKTIEQNTEITNLNIVEAKLKEENIKIKQLSENLNSELDSIKAQSSILKKNNELLVIENSKLKYDIDSYKSEINSNKDKFTKQRSEIYQSKNNYEKVTSELNKVKGENETLSKIKESLVKKISSLEKRQSTQITQTQMFNNKNGSGGLSYSNNSSKVINRNDTINNKTDDNIIRILELERQIEEKTVDIHVLELKLNEFNRLKNEVFYFI